MSLEIQTEELFICELNKFIIDNGKGDKVDPITKITQNIYIGQGRTTLYGDMLSTLGITHILSIGRSPHSSVKEGNFERLEITNLPDIYQSDMTPHFTKFFNFMNQVKEKNGKVYIHCEMGCSRSAVAVIAILKFLGYVDSLQDGYNLVKSKRPWIRIGQNFQHQIRCFFNEELICN